MPELVISWVAAGALAGLLVYLFSPRRVPGGLLTNLLVGVLGGCLGGYLISGATGTDMLRGVLTWGHLIVTAIAAMLALALLQTQADKSHQ